MAPRAKDCKELVYRYQEKVEKDQQGKCLGNQSTEITLARE